jgi:AcrR family transcriptional regulator
MKWKAEQTQNPLINQEGLWNAALEAFATQAFREASLNEIIRKAGMNKGSFYYRFYDKLDLYLSLMERMAVEKLALFSAQNMQGMGSDFFEDFRNMALLSLRFAQKEQRYLGLWRRFMSEDEEIKRQLREEFGGMSQDAISAMIEMSKAQGKLRKETSTLLVASIISALLNTIDQVIDPESSEEEIIAEIDNLIDLLKHGIL